MFKYIFAFGWTLRFEIKHFHKHELARLIGYGIMYGTKALDEDDVAWVRHGCTANDEEDLHLMAFIAVLVKQCCKLSGVQSSHASLMYLKY